MAILKIFFFLISGILFYGQKIALRGNYNDLFWAKDIQNDKKLQYLQYYA